MYRPAVDSNFWNSKGLAWFWTILVEVVLLIAAVKDPVPAVALVQYGLLIAPPLILWNAFRQNAHEPVRDRVILVYLIGVVLDLLRLR